MALSDRDHIQFGQAITLVFEPVVAQQDATRIGRGGMAEVAQTIVDAEAPQIPTVIPELVVTIAGNPEQRYPLTANTVTIGRSDNNDIVIRSQIISRHHARLDRIGDSYRFVPLPEATNPVLLMNS